MRSRKSVLKVNPFRTALCGLGSHLAVSLIWLTIPLLHGATKESSLALPVPHPDWILELVAQAPDLRHPSVVCSAPDGRVFVAEDPMDISTDHADEKQGRILCFSPGGKTTVFAEGLHAVFGMKYLEGKLYVLHNPRFSVFRDDEGVGKDREDLIESTNPEPWAKDWNDHIPANFSLGMDGYFYVAVGDKGLYGAVGRDGRQVDLHGGGVVRLRPDGTRLEIFATGLRNILDIAITQEDDLFTYDNTDEKQWMSRFSHIVEGGYYGYPYDFNPREPFIHWCMADYGAGAATGAFADTEGRIPDPFAGRIFLADFGKRQVTAVRVQREGSTFKAMETTELFPEPPADFRPVGIAPTADGTGLYICDWQHRDDKAKVTVGRLFRLRHAQATGATNTPSWYIPAASGRGFTASTADLIRGLSDPSRSVRLTAQRRLSERGQEALQPLIDLLQSPKAPSLARCHALWALDGMDGGEAGRGAITAAVYSLDPEVRRQATRQLGTRGVRGVVEELIGRLDDEVTSVRFQACVALGRIADPTSFRPLWDILGDPVSDEFLQLASARALNLLARTTPTLWPRVVAGLSSPNPRLAAKVTWVVRDTYDPSLIGALSDLALRPDSKREARLAAVRLLADLHRQTPEWKGDWWAYHPVNLPRPEKTRDWEFTPIVGDTLRALLMDTTEAVRRAARQAVASARVTTAGADLRSAYDRERDPTQRDEILATLGKLRDVEAAPLILTLLRGQRLSGSTLSNALTVADQLGSPSNLVTSFLSIGIARYLDQEGPSSSVAARALGTLGQLADPTAAAAVDRRFSDASPMVVIAALQAWSRISTNTVPLLRHLADRREEVRAAAVRLCGGAKLREAIPQLLEIAKVGSEREASLRALGAMPDLRALDVFLVELTNRTFTARDAASRYLRTLRDSALPILESQANTLSPEILTGVQRVYADHPTATNGPLFGRKQTGKEPEDYLRFSSENKGDVTRGRAIFANPAGIACLKCHRVAGEGGDVGPDLTQIGAQFDQKALAESVLWPSRVVREGYQQTLIELKDGDTLAGLIKGETAEILTLRSVDGSNQNVTKSQIQSRTSSTLSLMPEGLHTAISPQDFADLVAYLRSLKSKPSTPPTQ